jgi:hypothetical protein
MLVKQTEPPPLAANAGQVDGAVDVARRNIGFGAPDEILDLPIVSNRTTAERAGLMIVAARTASDVGL